MEPMAHDEEHLEELLKLPAKDRARAARRLLESLEDPALALEGMEIGSHSELARRLLELTQPDIDRSDLDTSDELSELDDIASDREELRETVRAAIQSELQPLHELTELIRRFAERARETADALRARTA
jgi:hypothetical protein